MKWLFSDNLLVTGIYFLVIHGFATESAPMDLRGSLATEVSLFPESPAYDGQAHNGASLAVQTELYRSFDSGAELKAEPFLRVDSADSNRTYADLRICSLSYTIDRWHATLGIDKVFWGVTEFVHLVDIINQTDVIESIDGEEKLGQPMLHISGIHDWGTLDGYFMPYFRERTFPGKEGRFRSPVIVDENAARFESGSSQTYPDLALRYSHTLANCDFGVSQFFGTSREPLLKSDENDEDKNKQNVLYPYYQEIAQSGVDLQYVYGQWLWKVEGVYRTSSEDIGAAAVFGFEYTLVNPLAMVAGLGVIGEYVHDNRRISDISSYDNDIMIGLRINLDDPDNTEFLVGMVQDAAQPTTIFTLEAGRQVADSLRIEVRGILLAKIDDNDPAYAYRNDSFFRLEVKYFF